jgi:hypothetical protein
MTTLSNPAEADLSKVDLTDLAYFEDGPPYELFARMRRGKPALERIGR